MSDEKAVQLECGECGEIVALADAIYSGYSDVYHCNLCINQVLEFINEEGY